LEHFRTWFSDSFFLLAKANRPAYQEKKTRNRRYEITRDNHGALKSAERIIITPAKAGAFFPRRPPISPASEPAMAIAIRMVAALPAAAVMAVASASVIPEFGSVTASAAPADPTAPTHAAQAPVQSAAGNPKTPPMIPSIIGTFDVPLILLMV
jgi:hypothetical protein